jgi:hypothetical protein
MLLGAGCAFKLRRPASPRPPASPRRSDPAFYFIRRTRLPCSDREPVQNECQCARRRWGRTSIRSEAALSKRPRLRRIAAPTLNPTSHNATSPGGNIGCPFRVAVKVGRPGASPAAARFGCRASIPQGVQPAPAPRRWSGYPLLVRAAASRAAFSSLPASPVCRAPAPVQPSPDSADSSLAR